jgi:hypothetical protein
MFAGELLRDIGLVLAILLGAAFVAEALLAM